MNIKSLFLATLFFLIGTFQISAQANTNTATQNLAADKSAKDVTAKQPTAMATGARNWTKTWQIVVSYDPRVRSRELKHDASSVNPAVATQKEAVVATKKPKHESGGVPVTMRKTAVQTGRSILAAGGTFTTTPVTKIGNDKTAAKTSDKAAASNGDWTKTWSILATFNTSFNSNLEHDPIGVKAAGFAPSLITGYQVRSSRHRVRFIYGLSGSRYTRSTDLNRIGNYFGASYRLTLGRWSWETEGEAMFKGTNDDRETNNQFIATQKLGYRLNDNTKATAYYAYRLRRFPAIDADRNAVNPMYGFKFERKLGDKLDLELGYRYDQNRAISPRQNYIRSTYSTAFQYRFTRKDLFETGFSYRPRLYSRLVDVDALRLPRRDRKYSFDAKWRHEFDRFGFELGYGYEKQNSNDVDKIYNDHQIDFSIFYHWGNGETIKP